MFGETHITRDITRDMCSGKHLRQQSVPTIFTETVGSALQNIAGNHYTDRQNNYRSTHFGKQPYKTRAVRVI